METKAVHLSEREKALNRWNKNTTTKYETKREKGDERGDGSHCQMKVHCVETDKAVKFMRKIR